MRRVFTGFAVLLVALSCTKVKKPLEPELFEPKAIDPVYPVDGAIMGYAPIAFNWEDVENASGYQIQIDDDQDFSSPKADKTIATSIYTESALTEGDYYWRVRSKNENVCGAWIKVRTIKVRGDVPGIVSPANGAVFGFVNSISFDWNDVQGATKYQIQIDDNQDFSSLITNDSITTSGFTWDNPTSGTFYWRVRAGNVSYWGIWATERNLIVQGEMPMLLFPANDTTFGFINNLTFDWDDMQGATKYQIQIDDDQDFSSPVINDSIATSGFTWNNPTSGIFYWRVKAGNTYYWGIWSTKRDLEIGGVAPNLLTPANSTVFGYVNSIAFDWSDVQGATKYQIQIDDDQDFSSPIISKDTSNSTYTWASPPSGIYYFRVRAGNNNYFSNWTNIYNIFKVPYEVGALSFYLNSSHIEVNGSFAYLADYGYGLRVINISNPSNPYQVSNYTGTKYPYGFAVYGDYMYLTEGFYYYLHIIYIGNPYNLTEISAFDPPGDAVNVFVSGNNTYTACTFAGLQIINVSNASNPYWVGQSSTSFMADGGIYVYNNIAYATGWGVAIINVSDPSNPSKICEYTTPDQAKDIWVDSNYAYIAATGSGLRIVNVSNPASPVEVGYIDTPGITTEVVVLGGYAYLADYSAGMRIIDISNKTNPKEVGYYDTPGDVRSIAIAGKYAYVADEAYGFKIVRVQP